MGEAKNRPQAHEKLLTTVERVSVVLRKLATAASGHFGSDCYLHAEMGRCLLQDLGIETRRVVGYAAFRVGEGDGDVIAHTDQVQCFLPPGAAGMAYHAWLEAGDTIIDFTTYQLEQKARELDALDGNHTLVKWCPEYLVLRKRDVHTYRAVASLRAGMAHYDEKPELESLLASQFQLDEGDLAAARLILSNPQINVMGPRT